MMPSGTKIASAVAITDTTLPLFNPDLAMPVASSRAAKGLLGIWDMNHSYTPSAAGAATGLAIPNAAWEDAAALLGSGTSSSLAATFTTDSGHVAGTTSAFERTSKGGLHGIVSQTNITAADQGAYILLPSAIRTYLLANLTHNYFVSVWSRITRVAASGSSSLLLAAIQNNASPAANYLVRLHGDAAGVKQNGVGLGSASLLAINTLGNDYSEFGASGQVGTVTSSSFNPGMYWGSTSKAGASQNSNSGNFNKAPSWIFYRMHLEDLTVSGRTFAQAAIADQAAWTLAFGAGGRFNGDTFTTPAI
ncbi:hypothetical protein [Microbacterium sp. NFH-22A-Y]|uniref:hypothetical protein n=1 Tax=Microbacterium sp. NFH-22A-Y TaxID=2744448 RepID=UPI001F4238C3|nr:hypothetical protein [Microbacterium sp. NFH-22A-Y]